MAEMDKKVEKGVPAEIEKPKVPPILPSEEVAKKEIESYVRLFKHFELSMRDKDGGLQYSPELLASVWEGYLDMKTSEHISERKTVQEAAPATPAQLSYLKKITDKRIYPELKEKIDEALKAAKIDPAELAKIKFGEGGKLEVVVNISTDQAHQALDVLAPLAKSLGFRSEPVDDGFKTGDKY